MTMLARYPRSLTTGVLSLLLLLAASTEAFSNEAVRPALLKQQQQQQQQRTRRQPPNDRLFHSSALQQASVALPEYLPQDQDDDASSTSVFRKLRSALKLPRGGAAQGRTLSSTTKQDSFLKRHPFLSAVAITTVNAVLADLLTQLVFQSSSSSWAAAWKVWNWKRTAVFGGFGFLYQGVVQYAIVNGVWEKVFPGTSRRAVLSKICAMNLLSDPLLFMPTFYIFQHVITSGSLTLGTVQAALMAYKSNCLMDWRNSWMVWFPGHAVTYGVMPSHKRIPWMAFLSFFYMCILSITRG